VPVRLLLASADMARSLVVDLGGEVGPAAPSGQRHIGAGIVKKT